VIAVITLLVVCIALALGIVVLVVLWRHEKKVAERLEMLAQLLDDEHQAIASFPEIKDFYDDFSAEIKSQIEEAYQQRDKKRVQDLQRMRERLDRLKARVLDRAVNRLNPKADGAREKGKGTKQKG
jgi:hypothetical protein